MRAPPVENPFAFADGEPRFPTLRPKDAASLVLVRREKGLVRVLMGERNVRHAFLPGRFVFPGGKLDAADQRLAIATQLRPDVRAKVEIGTSASRARGLALAAIRETFEETGVLIGARVSALLRTRSKAWRRFLSHDVTPHIEHLEFIARAITPPGRPRRFDARFFMVDAEQIAHTLEASAASGELLKPVWLTLSQARSADVLPITRCIFDEIEARTAPDCDPIRPVPFFIPHRGKAVIKNL